MTDQPDRDALALHDLDTVAKAVSAFFKPFTPEAWAAKAGADWTYADLVWHLYTVNDALADRIAAGRAAVETDGLATLDALAAWNAAQGARRPAGLSGSALYWTMRDSQKALRDAITLQASFDLPVFIPFLRLRGWRTVRHAVEYAAWHNWLHLGEASLRRGAPFPTFDAALTTRLVTTTLDWLAGMVTPERAGERTFIWRVVLTDAGTWSLIVRAGACRIYARDAGKADVTFTTDLAAFMRCALYGLLNPVVAFARRHIQVDDLARLPRLAALFAASGDLVWTPRP